jgi:hypothetical protein
MHEKVSFDLFLYAFQPLSNDDLSAFGSSMVRGVDCLTILAVVDLWAVDDVKPSLPLFSCLKVLRT